MATLCISLLFTSILLSYNFPISKSELSTPNPIRYSEKSEKSVVLHFYVQNPFGGPNSTVWEVARAKITGNSPTLFGQVQVVDDKLTAEPNRDSAEVGRIQGLITSAGLFEAASTINANIVFTTGEFNGSTLCILGRDVSGNPKRELAVVGGTGKFRMARGHSISHTYSFDTVEKYAVLEYKVYVYYV